MTELLTLKLKSNEERRLRAGHLWVFSNEIQTDDKYKAITPGTLCRVVDARNKGLGIGYVNPHALMAIRMLTGNLTAEITADWFARRFENALALRARLYPTPHYRLVYGEADGLPGLIVDRYGEVLVVQISTAGMEQLKPLITAALQAVLKPRGIVFRNDVAMREMEGLPSYVEEVGKVTESVEIDEGGVRFIVPMKGGQKTGWFFDQRDNRERLARYARDARVLDVFSYAGAWALRAQGFGASEASCIDSSQTALDLAQRNAELNGATVSLHKGEALDVLRQLRSEGREYDLVVVDPPAFIKRKKDEKAGLEHYAALNRAALQLLAKDGILVSCSCSFHLEPEQLLRVLLRESRATGRSLQVLEQGGQGPDHPVHPAIPETRYLKAYFARALHGG